MQRKKIQNELSNLRAELQKLVKERTEKEKMLQQLQKGPSSSSSQRPSSSSSQRPSSSSSQRPSSSSSQRPSSSRPTTVSSLGWTRTIKKPTIQNRLYLSARKYGALFDPVKRAYYMNKKIIYLNIPSEKRQSAKKLGAKFDWNKESWYIEASLKRKNKQAYDKLIEKYLEDYESDFENDEDSQQQQDDDLEYEQYDVPKFPSRKRRRVYLNVPRQSKEIAKSHGARWDGRYRVRKWYIDLTIPEKKQGDYSLLRRRFT